MCANWILEISLIFSHQITTYIILRSNWHVTPNETIQEVMYWLGINHIASTQSQLSRDVDKVVSILPEDGTEIQIKDLRAGLNAYGFDTQYQNQILKETGQNHRDIRARRNSYEHENSIDKIYLRRL